MTTCGNLVGQSDLRDKSNGIMATFTFIWRKGPKGRHESLKIQKSGERKVTAPSTQKSTRKFGCGKDIDWKTMAPVPVPKEFGDGKIGTDDIEVVPPSASEVKKDIGKGIRDKENAMRSKQKPRPSGKTTT